MLKFLSPRPNLIRSCKQIKLNWTKSFSVPNAERLCEVCKEARVAMHPPAQHLKLRIAITNNKLINDYFTTQERAGVESL